MGDNLFIYIGNDHVIESKQIISILEFQLIHSSLKLKQLINKMENNDRVFGIQADAKSIIITDDSIYYSPFATLTLKKREELYAAMNQVEKE